MNINYQKRLKERQMKHVLRATVRLHWLSYVVVLCTRAAAAAFVVVPGASVRTMYIPLGGSVSGFID